MQLGEQATLLEALGQLVHQRDTMNLLLAKHVERLVREKEVLLQYLGVRWIEEHKPAEEAPRQSYDNKLSTAVELNADLQRYLQEFGVTVDMVKR